jgi:hypothetical protein
MPSKDRNIKRRAGQRADELLPGESSEESAGGSNAAGTPGGGRASGGLAGTNSGDGSYDEDVEQQEVMNDGIFDYSGDRIDEAEPESGRAGRAAGGTPAGKRAGPRLSDQD